MHLAVGLHREGLQPVMDCPLGDPCCCRHSPCASVGTAVEGRGPQRAVDHLGDRVILIGAWPAEAQFVVQVFLSYSPVPLGLLADGQTR